MEVLQAGTWKELADFPFVNNSIYLYSMVTFDDSLYLFGKFFLYFFTNWINNLFKGGLDDTTSLDIVVKTSQIPTDANMWTRVGSLLTSRFSHRSVVVGGSIMHIGGYGGT